MKENAILLMDIDLDCAERVAKAAAQRDRGVLTVRTTREAFKTIRDQGSGLDAIIVNLDPGAHGLALLEAIHACADKPPAIVITSLEESYMKPIALKHGAMACLAKPIDVQTMTVALDHVLTRLRTCDRWGRLIPPTTYEKLDLEHCIAGIAQKLRPA